MMKANEAREISRKQKISSIGDIYKRILKVAEKGGSKLLIYETVDDEAIKILKKDGYKVFQVFERNDYLCQIEW